MPDSLTHLAPQLPDSAPEPEAPAATTDAGQTGQTGHTKTPAVTTGQTSAAKIAKPRVVERVDSVADNSAAALDSMATDSLTHAAAHPAPAIEQPEPVAPPEPPAWTEGLEPAPLHTTGATDPATVSVIVLLLVAVMISFRHSGKLMGAMFRDLLSVRTRDKSFDEHTASENRLIAIFGLQVTVFMGIIIKAALDISAGRPPLDGPFVTLLPFVGLYAVYYLMQTAWYTVVGWTFADSESTRMWLRGFNAMQSFLGFAVAVPALVTVFYPAAAQWAVAAAAGCYLIARLIFISKGLRIFYSNFGSLIYFILYLCTLEIVPLIFIFKISTEFVT